MAARCTWMWLVAAIFAVASGQLTPVAPELQSGSFYRGAVESSPLYSSPERVPLRDAVESRPSDQDIQLVLDQEAPYQEAPDQDALITEALDAEMRTGEDLRLRSVNAHAYKTLTQQQRDKQQRTDNATYSSVGETVKSGQLNIFN